MNVGIVLWDMIEKDEYEAGEGTEEYKDRFRKLENQFKNNYNKKNNPMIQLVKTDIAESYDEVMNIFTNYLKEGEEGVIIKDTKNIWQNKRSKTQCKLKQELVISLRVIGTEEGARNSKYEGQIGALKCQSEDGLLEVGVGSGLNDNDRSQNPEYFIGKVIDVKCNMVIQSKDANKKMSLFLPRFVEIRIDKTIADTVDYIISQDLSATTLNK